MQVSNLHSLLGGQWMIEQSFAMAMQPYLLSILKGKPVISKMDNAYSLAYASMDENGNYIKSDKKTQGAVAVVGIKSPIFKYDQECGPKGTKTLGQILTNLDNDSDITAIVLDIDSGGGQVSGTAEFAELIHNLKKPVVTYTDGMLASAAYEIAAATDYIIANKHADRVGSAGTYIELIDIKGIIEKAGGKVHTVYAEKSTKKNEAFRELVDKGNAEVMIKQILNPITDKLHQEIFDRRPQLDKSVADGRAVYPKEALKLGLIDALGTLSDAVVKAQELATKNEDINMSDNKNYEHVANILGLDELKAKSGLLGGNKGFNLTADQLQALDDKLAEINTVQAKASERETQLTAIETAVANAMATAGVEADDNIKGIEAVAELAKKYNESNGSTPTAPVATKDPEGTVDTDDILEQEFKI